MASGKHTTPPPQPLGVSLQVCLMKHSLLWRKKKKKTFKPVGRDPCHGTRWFYTKTDRWTNAQVRGQLEDHDATAKSVLTWIHPTFPEHLSLATKFTPATRVGYIFLQSPQQPARWPEFSLSDKRAKQVSPGLEEALQHHMASTHFNSNHRGFPALVKARRSPTIKVTHASYRTCGKTRKEISHPETTPVGILGSFSMPSLQ